MKLRSKQWLDRWAGNLLIGLFLPPVRLLGITMRRNHGIEQPPKAIVVIKILGLGSLIAASDALYSLRQQYPKAKLVLVCSRVVADGMAPLQLFEDIRVIDDRNTVGLIRSSVGALRYIWGLGKVWTVDFEVYSKLTTLFSCFTLAINRFGYQSKQVHFRWYFNTHNVYFNQFCPVSDNYRKLVIEMGAEDIQVFEPTGYSPTDRPPVEQQRVIAINNTCSDLALERLLPEDQLAALCHWILGQTEYDLAFCGAPRDQSTNRSFIERHLPKAGNRVRNLAGELAFDAYYDFLFHRCLAMITVDSAPLHMAQRLSVPTLSIWGPTNPAFILSPEKSIPQETHYLSVACSPCVHHTEILPCGGDNFCMKNMKSDQLIAKFQRLLERLHSPAHELVE